MERVNINRIAEEGVGKYEKNKIALVNDIRDIRDIHAHQNTTFLLEGYILALLIKGQAEVVIGEKTYNLSEGNVFMCKPKNILERSMFSMDIEIRSIFVSPEYANEIFNKISMDLSILTLTTPHNILHMDPKIMEEALIYFQLLEKKLEEQESEYKEMSIDSLIISFIFTLFCLGPQIKEALKNRQFSSAENYFQMFLTLLNDTKVPFMSVKQYAEHLHITPKYFSAICKQVSGKSANTIINEKIICMAQSLLRDRNKSIKQIADELNFNNQSHFGSFFRKHMGKSPQQYREAISMQEKK